MSMMDLFELAEKRSNATDFTVSELSAALKKTIEDSFGFVRVRGEIAGYRGVHDSGHAYFALKDDKAKLDAVIWRGSMLKLKFQPEEGMEIIAMGRLTTYPGSSKYQLIIETFEPAGVGALMMMLEERRKKLAAEGLFDEKRKQPLPFMPRIIGVVTSPTGAVIRDIIHRISDRFPLHILVWPVRVQGEDSAIEIAQAIDGFNNILTTGPVPRPDLLIIARGGGSLEDLWSFNDERVVRAISHSNIPVISAIGHETDWTLADYVADKRAPTPTAAAEMAVPLKEALQAEIASLHARLRFALLRLLKARRQFLLGLIRALPAIDKMLALPWHRYDEVESRLKRSVLVLIQHKKSHFSAVVRGLFSLDAVLILPKQHYRDIQQRFFRSLTAYMAYKKSHFSAVVKHFSLFLVSSPIKEKRGRLAMRIALFDPMMQHIYQDKQQKFFELCRLIKMLSYENILERGFTLIFNDLGEPVKRADCLTPPENVMIRFVDGEIAATTHETSKIEQVTVHKADKKQKHDRCAEKKEQDNQQGRLF